MALLRRPTKLPVDREYFMAWLGGSEGGLATTTAIVAGLMASTTELDLIALTAIISFMVQGFNGSMGHFEAARTDDEINREDHIRGYRKPALNALLHFLSHVTMGSIALAPIVLIANPVSATIYAILITLMLLFGLGFYKAVILEKSPWRDGFELVVLGSLVISIGIISGIVLR